MTAFGPYKDSETIDFNELQNNDLYVISGNTGAGKTTIFDGICFALYGTASGEDRENHMMLRSDFANDDTHTSAELEFELKGRTYRILRQLGHVKQGNKTKTGERYEFYEMVDGGEEPCVDRQIVSEINRKVETLMGLTEDQFKQIVMLPQGEFRKLLTSETENKEEILRRLFKTDSYKHMGEQLRQKKSAAAEVFNQVKQTRDTYIEHIKAVLPEREEAEIFQVLEEDYSNVNQVLAALEKELDYYTEQIGHDEKAYHEASKQQQKLQEQFHNARATNERFEELEQKEKLLKTLTEKIPVVKQKEMHLEKAERASKIEPVEERLREWREDQTIKEKSLTHARQTKHVAEEAVKQAKTSYEQEEKNKDERENVGKEVTRLKEFYPTVQQIDQNKQELAQFKKAVDREQAEVEKLNTLLNEKEKTLEKNQQHIKSFEQADSTRLEKHQLLTELRNQMKLVMAYEKAQKDEKVARKTLQQKKSALEQAKDQYNKLESTWLNNQAIVLASHLHDGESCPVCGSLEHPQKAMSHSEDVSRDKLDAHKKIVDQKETEYQEAAKAHSGELTRLTDRENDLKEMNISTENIDTLKEKLSEQGVKLKEEVACLDANKTKLDELRKTKEILEAEIKKLKTEKEAKEQTYHKNNQKLAGDLAAYKERIRQIPDELRKLAVLTEKITEMGAMQKSLEEKWEAAQKNLQSAREKFTEAETNLSNVEKQLSESKQKRLEAEERFKVALVEAEFSTEEIYRDAKLNVETQKKLKDEIKEFTQHLSTTREQVGELKIHLKDKEKEDLSKLDADLSQARKVSEEASRKWNQTLEYQKQVTTLKEKIAESNEKTAESERQFNVVADLHDVIRGQNSKKVSFERYLQIDYLDQIIDAANQRLRDLSNGQYSLIRSDRQEAHGRQSGLALDVYDEYTGQTRDVKSLSGGEKFNASLCLALGMSDVIQSFQGNISIDTMFIDEGFGSLDEESLNKSIDTLVDLQQTGRMIGVISHVKELKAIFPAILEVTKTKEGYSETRFVVK
nr:SMC family ATPase [Virgibacillus sp. MSJ-26]